MAQQEEPKDLRLENELLTNEVQRLRAELAEARRQLIHAHRGAKPVAGDSVLRRAVARGRRSLRQRASGPGQPG